MTMLASIEADKWTKYSTCQCVVHVETVELDFLQMQTAIDEDSANDNKIQVDDFGC